MNMSKEVVVVDGKIMANGGSQEEAISTMTSVRTLKKVYPDAPHLVARHRRMLQAVDKTTHVQDNDDANDRVCFTSQEVDALVESVIDGSGTTILLEGRIGNGSTRSRTAIPIKGEVHTEGESVVFTNAEFVPVNPDRCVGRRNTRRTSEGNSEPEPFVMIKKGDSSRGDGVSCSASDQCKSGEVQVVSCLLIERALSGR